MAVGVDTRIVKLLSHLREVSLDLLRAPWLWLTKAGETKHGETLHAIFQLHFVKPAGLLEHRVLSPRAMRNLIVLHLDVGKSSSPDASLHVVVCVERLAARGEGAANDLVPFRKRAIWIQRTVFGVHLQVALKLLDPSTWGEVSGFR